MLIVDDKNGDCPMDSSYFSPSFIMKNFKHTFFEKTGHPHTHSSPRFDNY